MADKSLNRDASKLAPTTWDHGWGYRDTRLVVQPDECVMMTGSLYNMCGYPIPYLIPLIREQLAFNIDFRTTRPRTAEPYVSPVNRNEGFLAALPAALQADQFSTDDRERLIHSHGQTTTDEVSRVLYSNLHRAVDLVVWPESEDDCVTLVNLAREHDVCLIPYGGGTNVTDALQVPEEETRMVVSLDMRRMNAIEWIDAENQTACVQAGILGGRLEELLAEQGIHQRSRAGQHGAVHARRLGRHQRLRNETQPVRQHRGHRRDRHAGDTVRRCREHVRHAAPVRRRAGVQGGVPQRGER